MRIRGWKMERNDAGERLYSKHVPGGVTAVVRVMRGGRYMVGRWGGARMDLKGKIRDFPTPEKAFAYARTGRVPRK